MINIVSNIGSLHRACIWENIIFKRGLITKCIQISNTPDSPPSAVAHNNLLDDNSSTNAAAAPGPSAIPIASQIPSPLSPFAQGMVYHLKR
jgi:E3 ubiquitin-protein ligase HUWE1